MNLKKLFKIKDFYDAIDIGDKIVVYWYTTFCPDCIMMKPYLGKLERDFSDYTFYAINRDKMIDLAKHLEIYGIPSFLVFNDGEEKGRLVNKYRKSYHEVKSFIESVIT